MLLHPAYHLVNTAVIGQQENSIENLAIFGLATVTYSIAIMSIQFAFNNSLTTLISQAHGQGEPRLCSVYMNRQLILNVIVYVPLATLLLFSKYFFIAIGQEEDFAQKTAEFVYILLPGLYFFGCFHTYSKYLAGQREVSFQMYTNFLTIVLHIPITYLLAVYYGYGLNGVGWATSIHYLLRFLIIFTFTKLSQFNKHMVSLRDPDCYRNLMPQFKMSLYAMTMIIWTWWAFDMFTFMSSFMTTSVMAAQTVCRNITLMFYMIPVGLSQATSISVGNMIGKRNLQGAKTYALWCTITASAWGILSVLTMVIFGNMIILFFSEQEEVRSLVQKAFVLIGFYIFFECIQCIGSGIISGIGRQGKGSIFTLIGFWVIGIPISATQVFYYKAGIEALWFGPTLAHFFNSVCYYCLIVKQDWRVIIQESEERRLKEKNKFT
eukprot:403377332